MAKDLEKGDKVEWNTPQAKTEGEVVEKVMTGEKRASKAAGAQRGRALDSRKPPQLTREVRPCPSLAAALGDSAVEALEAGPDRRLVGAKPSRLARRHPVQRRGMAPPAVAGPAGADLVLRPGRSTLEARDHVLERQVRMPRLERSPAPYALRAVALEDATRALGPGQIGSDGGRAIHETMVTQLVRWGHARSAAKARYGSTGAPSSSATNFSTRRAISSRVARTSSSDLPFGSGRLQSR